MRDEYKREIDEAMQPPAVDRSTRTGQETRSLLLIESNTSGTGRLFCRAARKSGLKPVLVAKDASRYPYVAQDRIEVLAADTTDHSALAAVVRDFAASHSIAGVYSSSDYFIEAASRLALRLGFAGPDPEAVAICRNKGRQREAFKRAGLPVPKFRLHTSCPANGGAVAGIAFPVVVKPTEASGSVGVKLCHSPEEAAAQMRVLLDKKYNERGLPLPQEVLLEEYLDGSEYSVEMFGLQPVGITRKYLSGEPYFIEVGHDFPATISPQDGWDIQEAATQALSAVGLTWGPAHVEIRLTSAGPIVVEINPRLAGGFIPELVRLSSGIDLIESTIAAVIGEAPDLHSTSSKYASIRFLMPHGTGILGRVQGMEAAASLEGIADIALYRNAGDQMTSYGDFRDRLGHVIVCHDSAEAAKQAAQHAISMLVSETA